MMTDEYMMVAVVGPRLENLGRVGKIKSRHWIHQDFGIVIEYWTQEHRLVARSRLVPIDPEGPAAVPEDT